MLKKIFLNDRFILSLILLNAIILFLEGYDNGSSRLYSLTILDNLFTLFFIIEMLVKIRTYGVKPYFTSNWNRLDATLIILSLPALVAFMLNIDLVNVSYLLVFRILRVFKSFRFFQFIPNIDHMIQGVKQALRASLFAMLGFLIFIFITGILSHYIFQQNNTEYFSDPAKSLYSTFKIFTVEGWFDIPETITKDYTNTQAFFTYLYFVLIVLIGGIFGLSLVTSIFVDSMVSDNNDELERKVEHLETKIDEVLMHVKQTNQATKINNSVKFMKN